MVAANVVGAMPAVAEATVMASTIGGVAMTKIEVEQG
jgi:hypothetical protein